VVRGPYKPFPFPIGTRFGELTVIYWKQRLTKATGRSMGWDPICRCSCGWEGFVNRVNIKKGRSTRCNACAKLASAKRWWKYKAALPNDAHRSRLLARFDAAVDRCENPRNAGYHHYGARGIRVHRPWIEDRALYLQHVQTLPGWDNPRLDMDRVDNDRGYEPGNLRFATRSANMLNRRHVGDMQERIQRLEEENADLRLALRRAEESLHRMVVAWASGRP